MSSSEPRHAYLIMAHNNFYVLEKLLLLLDQTCNDIYLHIDKKTHGFSFEYFSRLVCRAKLIFPETRIEVNWGDFSQVEAELVLFEEALKRQGSEGYHYFHLLSGACLPIKTQEEIKRFFLLHSGKEFVRFAKRREAETGRTSFQRLAGWGRIRVSAIWPFRGVTRETNPVTKIAKHMVNIGLLILQRLVRYDRLRTAGLPFALGSQWVSVTGDLASEIVKNREFIRKFFRRSYCPDEHFIQTLVLRSSEFRDKVYAGGNVRLVDWKRGRPYTFQSQDFEEILRSDCLFARKFDDRVDRKVVDKLYEALCQKREA